MRAYNTLLMVLAVSITYLVTYMPARTAESPQNYEGTREANIQTFSHKKILLAKLIYPSFARSEELYKGKAMAR